MTSKWNGPNDKEIKRRAEEWDAFFTRFENCGDENDEGIDMDTLIAIAEAEDEERGFINEDDDEENYDPEKVDSEVEALEGDLDRPEEINLQMELARNVDMPQEDKFKMLSQIYSPDYIQDMAKMWKTREKELSKLDLPYWNYRKDEKFEEKFNQTKNEISFSRNYNSATTASSTNNSFMPFQPDPRQDSHFLHPNITNPNFSQSPFTNSNNTFRLPIEIQQYLQHNSVVNVRVREYDLSICNTPANNSMLSLSRGNMNSSHAIEQPNQRLALTNLNNDQMKQSMPKLPLPPPVNTKSASSSSNNSLLARSSGHLDLIKAYEQRKVKTDESSKLLPIPITNLSHVGLPNPVFKMPPPRKPKKKDSKTELQTNKNPPSTPKQSQSSISNSSLVSRSKGNLDLNKAYEEEQSNAESRSLQKKPQNVSNSSTSNSSILARGSKANLNLNQAYEQENASLKLKQSQNVSQSSSKVPPKTSKVKLAQDQKLDQIAKSSKKSQETVADVKLKKVASETQERQKITKPPAASSDVQLKKTPPFQQSVPQLQSKTKSETSSKKTTQKASTSSSSSQKTTLPARKSREDLKKRQDMVKLHPKQKPSAEVSKVSHQKKASLIDLTMSSSSSDTSDGISQSKRLCLNKEQQKSKKAVKELTLDDISTAGSSFSTDSDDSFFLGKAHYEKRRLNHRIKKLTKRNSKLKGHGDETSQTSDAGAVKKTQNRPPLQKLKPKVVKKPAPKDEDDSSSDGEAEFYALAAAGYKALELQQIAKAANRTNKCRIIDTDSD